MNILDITIDFETCALCPTAAVMSVGTVAWNREAEESPFTFEGFTLPDLFVYYKHVDMRSQFVDGFTFDNDTAKWWAQNSEEAKRAVLDYDDTPLMPIRHVIENLLEWMKEVKEMVGAKQVILWSQGSDFDIAILRNICYKYNIEIPVPYKNFRDHRTFFLEGAKMICDKAETEFDSEKAYSLVEPYEGEGVAHDQVFDCKQSIYSTWQMMRHLKCLCTDKTKV